MIPTIIHQIALGPPMDMHTRAWVTSVGRNHPAWSHIIWDEPMLERLGFYTAKLMDDFGSYASVSNFLRLHLLNSFGGIYLDTDMEAFAPMEPILFYQQRGAMAALQDGGRICNAFMGAEPENEWIRWQIENFSTAFDPRDPASGVYLATKSPHNVGLVPQAFVFPWMYDSPPERRILGPDSVLCHHWVGSWKK